MVDLSEQARRLLTEAGQPELVQWLEASGASSELAHVPRLQTDHFSLTVPLSEIRRTAIQVEDETRLDRRPLSPIMRIIAEMRGALGMVRASQISQRMGSEDTINVMLPLNAKQLNALLSVEGVQSVRFSEQRTTGQQGHVR